MITIDQLKKVYGGNTVLDIDHIDIAPGELIGLVGNNGAGKTTLLRLLLDLIEANDGYVAIDGKKVNEDEEWKRSTGSYIDGRFLIDFLTPEEYFSFIADVYDIDDATLQERLARFEGFMHDEIMGTKKYLRDFSQGNRQKIGIIGAMVIRPKLLLLDEPFNYLDPSSQMSIAKLIHKECLQNGTTVILSSHNLNFVADISSRILLLEKGKLIKDLPNTDGAAIAELNEYFGVQAVDDSRGRETLFSVEER
jgi:ABC-2 type transport system ATP-binding protein